MLSINKILVLLSALSMLAIPPISSASITTEAIALEQLAGNPKPRPKPEIVKKIVTGYELYF